MKLTKIIGIVALVLLVLFVAVSLFETPDYYDPDKLSKAEKVIVWVKINLEKLLGGLGVTAGAVELFLLGFVKRGWDVSSQAVAETASTASETKTSVDAMTAQIELLKEQNAKNNTLLLAIAEVFEMSELPASAREKLYIALNSGNEIKAKAQEIDIEAIAKAVTDKLGAVKQIDEPKENAVEAEIKGEEEKTVQRF